MDGRASTSLSPKPDSSSLEVDDSEDSNMNTSDDNTSQEDEFTDEQKQLLLQQLANQQSNSGKCLKCGKLNILINQIQF